MKTAIVTGTSRGIGLAVAQRLLSLGYKVYGISRTGNFGSISHDCFIPVCCDLLDTEKLVRVVEEIIRKEPEIDLLINNAGVGCFGPHEQLDVYELRNMIRTNLEAPIILSRLLLRSLKKTRGQIINMSSVTARKISTHGCAYAATKAGLSHFSESLFEEVRKSGVRVTTLQPDITQSDFYETFDFTYSQEPETSILPAQVADAVEYILSAGDNLSVQEITLRPRKNQIQRKPSFKKAEGQPDEED